MFDWMECKPEGVIRRLSLDYLSLYFDSLSDRSEEQTFHRTGYFRETQKFYKILREVDSNGKILFPSKNRGIKKEFSIQTLGYTLRFNNSTYMHSLSFQEFVERGRPIFIDIEF